MNLDTVLQIRNIMKVLENTKQKMQQEQLSHANFAQEVDSAKKPEVQEYIATFKVNPELRGKRVCKYCGKIINCGDICESCKSKIVPSDINCKDVRIKESIINGIR